MAPQVYFNFLQAFYRVMADARHANKGALIRFHAEAWWQLFILNIDFMFEDRSPPKQRIDLLQRNYCDRVWAKTFPYGGKPAPWYAKEEHELSTDPQSAVSWEKLFHTMETSLAFEPRDVFKVLRDSLGDEKIEGEENKEENHRDSGFDTDSVAPRDPIDNYIMMERALTRTTRLIRNTRVYESLLEVAGVAANTVGRIALGLIRDNLEAFEQELQAKLVDVSGIDEAAVSLLLGRMSKQRSTEAEEEGKGKEVVADDAGASSGVPCRAELCDRQALSRPGACFESRQWCEVCWNVLQENGYQGRQNVE
ncbi:hypothetical protein GGR56DRAFT_405179 [Xylariaceae sp. FL0804]|nr:hypothetical protein GGR56DRAFT_405179 [Xylariaceae sp. FL0804]